jgi:hypothetical protein
MTLAELFPIALFGKYITYGQVFNTFGCDTSITIEVVEV